MVILRKKESLLCVKNIFTFCIRGNFNFASLLFLMGGYSVKFSKLTFLFFTGFDSILGQQLIFTRSFVIIPIHGSI